MSILYNLIYIDVNFGYIDTLQVEIKVFLYTSQCLRLLLRLSTSLCTVKIRMLNILTYYFLHLFVGVLTMPMPIFTTVHQLKRKNM